jgi:hypothetical protein
MPRCRTGRRARARTTTPAKRRRLSLESSSCLGFSPTSPGFVTLAAAPHSMNNWEGGGDDFLFCFLSSHRRLKMTRA